MMQSLHPGRIVGIKWCGLVESSDSLGGDDAELNSRAVVGNGPKV